VQSARGWTVVAAAVVVVAIIVLEEGDLAEKNKTLPKRNGGITVFYLQLTYPLGF